MSKTKTGIKKAVRRAASTDPLRQFLTETLDTVVNCDPSEMTLTTDPLEQSVKTSDPLEQSLGNIDTLKSSVKIDNLRPSVRTDYLKEAFKDNMLGQSAIIDDNGKAGTIEKSRNAVSTDNMENPLTTDNSRKSVSTNTLGGTVTTDESAKAMVTDNSGNTVMTDESGKAGMTDNSGTAVTTAKLKNAAKSNVSRQAVMTDSDQKAVVADNFGKVVTNKTLHKTSNMDVKTNFTGEHRDPKLIRQYSIEYHAAEAKRMDFGEVSSISTMKSTKFKSKRSTTGKHDQINDFPQLKLSNFVDIQQLLNIGYRNSEVLPLVNRVSVINDIFANFSPQVQKELVSIIQIVEKTVKEFIYMKQTAFNSDEIQEVVYKLLPKLSKSFCDVVLKHGGFILDPAVRNQVEWNKLSKSLQKKKTKRDSSNDLFDLSFRFQIKDLVKIGDDHPEFKTNIKTIRGVSAAMKNLNHGGQVEIYKILRRMEKIIKDLVNQKTNPDGCHDIFLTTETLTSSLDYCIEKILMHLKASPNKPVKCFHCDLDRSHARNIDLPNIRNHLQANQLMSVFDCANWGVSHDRITNLESLIHHLVAKENALENFWSFQNCIDWFEIAHQHSKYRLQTIPDMLKIKILRHFILETLDKIEGMLVGARSFCEKMSHVVFVNNESLSDAIALSGQIEMLFSEVEHYLIAFVVLTGNIFCLLNEYGVVSLKLRDNRFLFLTKPQWNAFNFPF